jgi:uncharacterized membrane protein YoaK (UPF0700 family)
VAASRCVEPARYPSIPSTKTIPHENAAAMRGYLTGNLTKTVLSLLDTLSRTQPVMQGAKDPDQLKKTLELVVGFFAGCLAGAAAVSWRVDWAWSLPVILAGVAMAVVPGRSMYR